MFSLRDTFEQEQIEEKTSIDGLYWIRNYFVKSTEMSRIVLPNPGQGNFSIVHHASDFSEAGHGGYEIYGIHLGQVDVLTFLATDDRVMRGHFVDCRKGSPTLHRDVTLEFKGNPDRALVIDRGIAHIFDNLVGMVTLNQLRKYWDFANPDFNPSVDVYNVPRGTAPRDFPVLQVNRFAAPHWLCRIVNKTQRMALRKQETWSTHPISLRAGRRKITLTKVESA